MKKNVITFRIITLLSLLLTFVACSNNEKPQKETISADAGMPNPYEKAKIETQIFKVDSIEGNGTRGWGYNILIDGRLYIHQPNIPAVMGNAGFSSEEKAAKAGSFIVYKIRNNVLPPSVTPEELDSLGVLN